MGNRKDTIVYYGTSLLFSFIMLAAGVADLIPVSGNVAIFVHLGYPLYVLTIIGVAKILGALAISYGKLLTLKEWAYAGFTCDLVGALVSHFVRGDRTQLIFPALLLILMIISYVSWKKRFLGPEGAKAQRRATGERPL